MAGSVPEAAAGLRWQTTIILVYIPVFFVFVSLYTGQRPRKSWITVVTLISSLLLLANFLSPYSLRFISLDQTAQIHLPWGETLTRFYGTFGVGNALMRVFFTGVLIWAIWRTMIQYRLGAHRAALYLGITIVLLLLASIWGLLIDLGIINSFYIGGFALLAITLLMSISMSGDFREQNARLEAATSALRGEIEQRKKIEQLVKQCAASVSSFTGMAFLQKLVEQLAGLFNAEYAFIGKLNERDAGVINTLAVWAHGRLADNMSYALAHTPCANVVGRRTCVYPQGVREQFPQDKMLVEMGVESYIGSPLFDVNGHPMGLVVVLGRKSIQDTAILIDILDIFSVRAATEIQRIQTEAALHMAEEQLRATIEYTPNVAVQWYDQNGRVLFWNSASETLFGWRKEEAVGKTLDQLIHSPEELATFITTCKEVLRTGKPTAPTEYIFKRRDGTQGACISTVFALPEHKGQPSFVCMDVDIT
ncbi:MAG: PAS domain S-box protein, partial [Gammaproteobacteria bacterium]